MTPSITINGEIITGNEALVLRLAVRHFHKMQMVKAGFRQPLTKLYQRLFPERSYQRGETNCQSKYLETQIRNACFMMQNYPEASAESIARNVNRHDAKITKADPTHITHPLNAATVHSVFQGRTWKHVSKDYNFSARRRHVAKYKQKKNTTNPKEMEV